MLRLPTNARAAGCTKAEQAAKVLEEASEIISALASMESDERVLEESIDCLWALSGFLEKFPWHEREKAFRFVMDKAAERGDFLDC